MVMDRTSMSLAAAQYLKARIAVKLDGTEERDAAGVESIVVTGKQTT